MATRRDNERKMTSVRATDRGIEVQFADGCAGVIPYGHIPGAGHQAHLTGVDLPNPYEVVLATAEGEMVEIPWDFARHYADASYRPRVEAMAAEGRRVFGRRIRRLREQRGMTQEQVAAAAGIGRVTVVRIEKGEQAPRYETLLALARVFGRPAGDLLVGS